MESINPSILSISNEELKTYLQQVLQTEKLIAAQNALTRGTTVVIKNVTTEEKTEHPPKLFNITGLQKYCSEKFKYSPKKTLKIAQKLYEVEKCLSYPRTPSTVLGDDNVNLYQEKYDMLSKEYPELCKDCKPENISSSNKRIFNSYKLVDHHALIPLIAPPIKHCCLFNVNLLREM